MKVMCRFGSSKKVRTDTASIKEGRNHWDALITYTTFYKSCLHDKLITLSLTAAHSKGSKGAGLRGDGP